MDAGEYFSSVGEGFEFLFAFGSLVGFLGLIAGFAILLFGSIFNRKAAVKVLIISGILVGTCGLYTGIKYFRLF